MCHSNKISQSGRFIMDLLQLLWKTTNQALRPCLLFCTAISLTACAVSSPVQKEGGTEVLPQKQAEILTPVSEPEPEKEETLPLNTELVYYILTAELAGQRGEISVATELYNKAAMSVDSPALASRSAQVANFTRDSARINRALERWLEVDPDNAQVYIMHTPFLIMQGDYDGVVKSVNTAIRLAPEKSKLILAQVADNLSELAPQQQALGVLEGLDLYKQQDSEALFIYARLAAYFKQYEPALVAIDSVLSKQADREDALILKSEILQRQGKGADALRVLKNLASKNGASQDLRFAYAKLLGENNQTVQARKIFEQLNAELPHNEEVLFALGLLALEEKDGELAKTYFRQLISMGDPGKQAAYFMGLSEEAEKNTDAALIWFASVPAESSRFQAAQARYINLLADDGQLEKARLHLKLLRKEHPERAVQYYAFEAAFLIERQQKQAAFDLYTEALATYPTNSKLLYGRAMLAESMNNLTVFESDLKQILAREPKNATVLNALGYTLTDRTDRHQEALALIQQAVDITPNEPFYLDSLGWVYYRLGDLDKAETYLRQAIAIEPDVEFMAHLGEVLWLQGKKQEAQRIWQQALKLASDNELLNETLQRFGQ